MKAIQVYEHGGSDKMQLADIPRPEPKSGEALVKIHVAGVNFIDVYFRKGLYPAPLPITPGMEACGVVEALGPDTKSEDIKIGDRVSYAGSRGSYAEYAAVPVTQLVPVPADVTDDQAAAVMLQGMTAHYLTHSTFKLEPGKTCLLHAAAGGVGLVLTQIAKSLGATVIGTAGTPDKVKLAQEAGADHVINYTEQPDFAAEVRKLTGGKGVDVVYDSVGASTWEKSLDSLHPRGLMVTFGNASGPVPPFAPLLLNQKGSLFVTRPTLAHYTATREELLWRATDLFKMMEAGTLKLRSEHVYPLADARKAHDDLEGRHTTGKLLLKV